MVNRRTTVIALGGLLAGGGALLGTGAFSTVTAERSVALETAGDANAFLGLEIIDGDHVSQTDGTIDFDVIAESKTTFANLVRIRNNGTQDVTSLRFEFDVVGADQVDGDVEQALKIISGAATIDAVDIKNLLVESDDEGADDDVLAPGEAVRFGIAVDLIDADIEEISGDPSITLTIIADTEGETGGDSSGGGFAYDLQSVSLADGGGNDIDVTVSVDTDDPDAQLLIESVRSNPPGNQSPIRDDVTVNAMSGTYSVLGANQNRVYQVRVTLLDADSNVQAVTTRQWPP